MLFKKYDKDGYCPQGYEYVREHRGIGGSWVDSYCRKIPRKRHGDPDTELQRMRDQRKQESLKLATEEYSKMVEDRANNSLSSEEKL